MNRRSLLLLAAVGLAAFAVRGALVAIRIDLRWSLYAPEALAFVPRKAFLLAAVAASSLVAVLAAVVAERATGSRGAGALAGLVVAASGLAAAGFGGSATASVALLAALLCATTLPGRLAPAPYAILPFLASAAMPAFVGGAVVLLVPELAAARRSLRGRELSIPWAFRRFAMPAGAVALSVLLLVARSGPRDALLATSILAGAVLASAFYELFVLTPLSAGERRGATAVRWTLGLPPVALAGLLVASDRVVPIDGSDARVAGFVVATIGHLLLAAAVVLGLGLVGSTSSPGRPVLRTLPLAAAASLGAASLSGAGAAGLVGGATLAIVLLSPLAAVGLYLVTSPARVASRGVRLAIGACWVVFLAALAAPAFLLDASLVAASGA